MGRRRINYEELERLREERRELNKKIAYLESGTLIADKAAITCEALRRSESWIVFLKTAKSYDENFRTWTPIIDCRNRKLVVDEIENLTESLIALKEMILQKEEEEDGEND